MIYWYGETENSYRHQVLAQEGIQFEKVEDVKLFLKSSPSKAKALLFSENQLIPSFKLSSYTPESLMALGFTDGFLLENGRWTPKCSYLSVFRKIFTKNSHFLDTSRAILLVSDFEPARAAVITLYKMGFRDFFVLDKEGESNAWLDQVKASLFDLNVRHFKPQDLVNLSGEASVLVYGVENPERVLFERELSYLNFLYRPGLVLDFLSSSFLLKVIEETQDKDLKFLARDQIEKESLDWWKSQTKALV